MAVAISKLKRLRRQERVRKRVRGNDERPRLCVFRSGKHIYAQVIDDDLGKTLVSASSVDKAGKTNGGNVAAAKAIGNECKPYRLKPKPDKLNAVTGWLAGLEGLPGYAELLERKELRELIEQGKQRGSITYDELNDALPTDVAPDQLDDVMSMFGDNDIEIVDAQKAAQASEVKPTVAATEETEKKEGEEEATTRA